MGFLSMVGGNGVDIVGVDNVFFYEVNCIGIEIILQAIVVEIIIVIIEFSGVENIGFSNILVFEIVDGVINLLMVYVMEMVNFI